MAENKYAGLESLRAFLNNCKNIFATKEHNHNNVYESKTDASAKLTEAKTYTDTAITNLVNAAPDTLDTLGELAVAFEENKEVVDALDAAITNKADSSEVADLKTSVDSKAAVQMITWEDDD